MRFVGVDPGKSGAAVEITTDGATVIRVVRWARAETPPDTLAALLRDLGPGDVVAVEQCYVGPGARASLTLAEWTGRLLAEIPADVEVLRPLAAQWRAKVLRSARLGRTDAKAAADRAARLGTGTDVLTGHSSEAWCLARYAWGWSMRGER